MQFCDYHWTGLRQRIDHAGLGHLVASDAESITSRMQAFQDNNHTWTIDTYDPLLSAMLMITLNLTKTLGKTLVAAHEFDSRSCGLCLANAEHAVSCNDPSCPANPFDAYLDVAVSEEVETWLEMSVS